MSGIYILKNVYNFAQILNLAGSENLRKWDNSTLQKAVSWAQYCEEVYKHVQQQGCGNDMNSKLLQLSILVSPASFLRLNFESLKTARKLLTEVVLANPHGSQDLQKNLETLVDATLWSTVCENVSQRPVHINDLDEIFFIFWIQNDKKHQNFKDYCVSTYAQVFFTNLVDIMESADNPQRFQQYCESMCARLVSVNKGWELLVHVFTLDTDELLGCEERKKRILCIILSWMTLKTQEITKCPVLDMDLKLLKKASIVNPGFLTFYLSALENWSKCFQPCIDGSSITIWRDSDGNDASLLAGHFRSLLKCQSTSDKSLKSVVLTCLSDNIRSSDFTIWRTLANILLSH